MLNSFNEYQRVLVLGGKSEIALGILSTISVSEDAQLMLMGRDISQLDVPSKLRNSSVSFHNVNACLVWILNLVVVIVVVMEFMRCGDDGMRGRALQFRRGSPRKVPGS